MSVVVTYVSQVKVVETLSTNVPASSSPTIEHAGYNSSDTLNASSTNVATQSAIFSKALSTGTATIDLTSLTGTNGATVVGTGLKVQVAKFKNPSTNANSITIAVGASNGYNLLGSAFSATLAPGQEITIYGNSATPTIGSGAKTLDLAGTGSQALQCTIVMG